MDELSNKCSNKLTMEVFVAIANSIFPSIQFTCDVPEDHPNGMVPMLDFQIWNTTVVDLSYKYGYKDMIDHVFYEKDTASAKVMEYESAAPIRSKIVTLSQEIIRLMRNTSRRTLTSTRVEILTRFIKKLKLSKYPNSICQEVLEAGLKGYFRMVGDEINGKDRVNREAGVGLRDREMNKILGKANWFEPTHSNDKECYDDKSPLQTKKAPPNIAPLTTTTKNAKKEGDAKGITTKFYERVETVIFVPSTPGSKLCKNLQLKENAFAKLHNTPKV